MRTAAPSDGRTDAVVTWGVSTGKFMPQVGFFAITTAQSCSGGVVLISKGSVKACITCSSTPAKIKDIFSSGAVGLPNPSLMLWPAVVAAM